MKLRKICNWALAIAFLATAFSGIKVHVVGEQNYMSPECHIWETIHVIVALTFIALALLHARINAGWFKTLKMKAINGKIRFRRYMVGIMDTLYALLLITGLWMWLLPKTVFHEIYGTHYILGLTVILFSLWHIGKRIKQLVK